MARAVGAAVDFPLTVGPDGRTATVGADDHLRDLIEQVLFTAPGERVMLPEFGCGLLALVFEPGGELLAGATELLVRGALYRWLSDVIDVADVRVEAVDASLVVEVDFVRVVDGGASSVRLVAPEVTG